MSSPVAPTFLNPKGEIGAFLDFLYRDQTGFVYIATKEPESLDWNQTFFNWPNQRSDIISHVIRETSAREVYIGPALYSTNRATKEHIKGTNVLWTEFDGKLPEPTISASVPGPSLRIQSSEPQHEHWYWSLDYFEVDVEQIERANRGLCYTLGADSSAWDATQILRPPTTKNHKRDKSVVLLAKSDVYYGAELFSQIPTPEFNVKEIVLDEIPQALDVIAKYKWDPEAFTFFRKAEIPQGSRSSAMMRLAFYCAEMRMSDEEAYSILDNADYRWGKFKNRNDRVRRLQDLIFKARLKYPLEVDEPELYDEYPVYGFQDFLDTTLSVKWVIDGLLQESGFVILSGPPGIGKTTVSLQWAIHMALGKPFLGYEMPVTKCIFFSMEMGHADLKYFVEQMAESLTPDERATLQDNLLLIPLGFGVFLDKAQEQQRVRSIIRKYEPIGVFFDSLGSTTMDELSSESTVKSVIDFVERIRSDFNIFTWFIHHNRKATVGNKKPNKLSDVFGSQYITARATTVLGLWRVGMDTLEITGLKVRLAREPTPFLIARKNGLNFEREVISTKLLEGLAQEPTEESEETKEEEIVVNDNDTGEQPTMGF